MTLMNNTNVLLCNGYNETVYVPTCLLYMAGSNMWTQFASFPAPIANFAMVTLQGRVYALGGTNGTDAVSTVYAFDTTNKVWTALAAMPEARQWHKRMWDESVISKWKLHFKNIHKFVLSAFRETINNPTPQSYVSHVSPSTVPSRSTPPPWCSCVAD